MLNKYNSFQHSGYHRRINIKPVWPPIDFMYKNITCLLDFQSTIYQFHTIEALTAKQRTKQSV